MIRKLGGSLEEQIAGLLHDISHTAFSHVIDFVFENQEEDYHEDIYDSVIQNSDIPNILDEHNYKYEEILVDQSKWTLLEQSAPELCADRIDYTLRDMYEYGHIKLEDVKTFLDDLIVKNHKIYIQHVEVAEWFVETYYKEVIDFFMNPLNIYGYDTLAAILIRALEKKVINIDNFMGQDHELINIMLASGDKELNDLIDKLNYNVVVVEDQTNFSIYRKNKLRMINPSVCIGGELIPASMLSRSVKNMNEETYEKASKGVYLRIISN